MGAHDEVYRSVRAHGEIRQCGDCLFKFEYLLASVPPTLEVPHIVVESGVNAGDNVSHSGAKGLAFRIRHDCQSLDRATPQNARLEPVAADLVTVVGGGTKA
jgi:hypothetical protein